MKSYFEKVKGSALQLAKQGIAAVQQTTANAVSSVSAAATAATTINTSFPSISSTSVHSGSNHSMTVQNKEVFEDLFNEICAAIDAMAMAQDSQSVDADIRLSQSNVRSGLKRLVALMQTDSDIWLQYQMRWKRSTDEKQELSTPCIDTFLQDHYLQKLCDRIISDNPKGIMPLVMSAISSIIRGIAFPLLPHQCVHRPLAKLIFIASRYEGLVHISNGKPNSSEIERNLSYKRRLDISMTSLLRALWRKIMEHPPCFDYFILSDRRTSSLDPVTFNGKDPALNPKIQIDILLALIPLVHDSKVGKFVQETILIALNVKDTRIDSFLAYNTKFITQLVRQLCESFIAASQFLQKNISSSSQAMTPTYLHLFCSNSNATATTTTITSPIGISSPTGAKTIFSPPPPTPMQRRASLSPNPSSNNSFLSNSPQPMAPRHPSLTADAQTSSNPSIDPLTSFLKSLVFLRAVYCCLKSREIESVSAQADGATLCLQQIVTTYRAEFLNGAVQSMLESANELNNTAVYLLLNMLLSQLSFAEEVDSDASSFLVSPVIASSSQRERLTLLGETLRFLVLSDAESVIGPGGIPTSVFFSATLDRLSSLSKPLALSSSSLLMSLSATAPPLLALHLLHASKPTESSLAATGVATRQDTSHLADRSVYNSSSIEAISGGSIDEILSRLSKSIEIDSLSSESISKDSASSLGGKKRSNQSYKNASMIHIMQKIYHRGDSLLYLRSVPVTELQSNPIYTSPARTATGAAGSGDAYQHRVLKRLQGFLTLRMDEQISLSGLVKEIACLLITSALVDPNESAGKESLKRYHQIIMTLSAIKGELTGYLRQIPDAARKLALVVEYLEEESQICISERVRVPESVSASGSGSVGGIAAGANMTQPQQSKQQQQQQQTRILRRRMLDSESYQNRQILSSMLILQEMEQEVQSYVFSALSVRRLILDSADSDSGDGHPLISYAGNGYSNASMLRPVGRASRNELGFDRAEEKEDADIKVQRFLCDEEEFKEDSEELETVKALIWITGSAAVSRQQAATGAAHSAKYVKAMPMSILDIDQREKEFLYELEVMETSIDSFASRDCEGKEEIR